jgi:hypothetical protein
MAACELTATTTFIRYVCIGRGLDRIKGRSLATPTPRPTAHGRREKGSPSPLIEPSIFHVPTVQESNHTMHLHRPVPCSSIGRSSKQAKASARGQEATAKSGGCSTDREVSPSAAKARLVFPYAAIACAACSTERPIWFYFYMQRACSRCGRVHIYHLLIDTITHQSDMIVVL